MAQAQHISASQAARLLGKPRSTILNKVHGLETIQGPHNSKLYDADELMTAVYLGRKYFIWIEDDEKGTPIDI